MKKATSAGEPARIASATKIRPATVEELLGLSDSLQEHLRGRIVELVTALFDAEIDEAIGAERYARETRGGYRYGHRSRMLTTSLGRAELELPRARLFTADGGTEEFRSGLLPRYKRRCGDVDGSIVLSYLSGTNTRKIEKALEPMLKGASIDKSTVSRVVQQLKRAFDKWRVRPLSDHRIAYLFLDAIVVKVKVDRRSREMAVLVALGIHETGERELLALRLVTSESTEAWKEFVEDLSTRGLRAPVLCIVDGNSGLRKAIAATWPMTDVQRCVVHKLRNLQVHCPKASFAEMLADYRAIFDAPNRRSAKAAYDRFLKIWRRRCPAVAESMEEAGEELLTHFRYPRSQWKALRTTNAIERLLEEFRRRVKTQGSLPNESSVLYLFYGLWATGQVQLRKMDGWEDIKVVLAVRAEARDADPTTDRDSASLTGNAGRTRAAA